MADTHTDLLFELLHSEIINYADSNDNSNKTKQMTLLEKMGYRIGYSLAEQLTKDIARFNTDLEIMKFVCKDLWTSLYQKQVDNLKTNHQGVYVLHDNEFKFFTHISDNGQYLEHAPKFLAIPSGLVRGVLANLGVNSLVHAETTQFPKVTFQIMIQPQN